MAWSDICDTDRWSSYLPACIAYNAYRKLQGQPTTAISSATPLDPQGPEDIQFAPATPMVEPVRAGFFPQVFKARNKPVPIGWFGAGVAAVAFIAMAFFWRR